MPHNRYGWQWNPKFRINLHEYPGDGWREAYHWLEEEWHAEVLVKINEDLETVAYLCEVEEYYE